MASPLNLISDLNNDGNSVAVMDQSQDEFGKLMKKKTITLSRQTLQNVHICYFICLLLTITIGTVQYGWSIGCWNSGWLYYAKSQNLYEVMKPGTQQPMWYNQTEAVNTQLTVQAVTTGGSMFGALIAGPISRIGRWRSIMFCNVLVIIGNILQFFWSNWGMFLAGRAIFGVAAGGFSCVCPKYINEVSPKVISGPAGAMFQVMVALGVFLSLIVTFPFDPVNDEPIRVDLCLYILFGIPIALALIQSALLITIFTYDTPRILNQKGEMNDLRKFLFQIYEPQAVQEVIDELVYDDDADQQGGATYGQICCSSAYLRATFVGIGLSMFQQLTGINMVMLYSSTILKDSFNFSISEINALVGGVSLCCAIVGLILLNCLGRKTIMVIGNFVMAVTLVTFGVNMLLLDKGIPILATSCFFTFLAFFQFSSGPITWLYMAEIMQDRAQSIATVLNWSIILGIAIGTPLLDEWLTPEGLFGWVFVAFGAFTALGFIFVLAFMRETKDLSPVEIDALFNRGNALNIKQKDLLAF